MYEKVCFRVYYIEVLGIIFFLGFTLVNNSGPDSSRLPSLLFLFSHENKSDGLCRCKGVQVMSHEDLQFASAVKV